MSEARLLARLARPGAILAPEALLNVSRPSLTAIFCVPVNQRVFALAVPLTIRLDSALMRYVALVMVGSPATTFT